MRIRAHEVQACRGSTVAGLTSQICGTACRKKRPRVGQTGRRVLSINYLPLKVVYRIQIFSPRWIFCECILRLCLRRGSIQRNLVDRYCLPGVAMPPW